MTVWGGSRITVWERNISFHIVCIESIKYVSTLRKNIFNCISEVFLSLDPKTLGFFSFLLKSFWERSKITVSKNLLNTLNTWTFWLLLHQICKRTKVKVWQRNIPKIFFATEVLGMCLPYDKNLFSTASVKFLFSLGVKIFGFFCYW